MVGEQKENEKSNSGMKFIFGFGFRDGILWLLINVILLGTLAFVSIPILVKVFPPKMETVIVKSKEQRLNHGWAKWKLKRLRMALKLYHLERGRYPIRLQKLVQSDLISTGELSSFLFDKPVYKRINYNQYRLVVK